MLITVGGIVPFAILAFPLGLLIKEIRFEIQRHKGDLGTRSHEAFSNIRTVKAFASERDEMKKFSETNGLTFD